MKLGVDTNVLVYTHIEAFPQHARVRAFMQSMAGRESTVFCLPTRVINEFVHIVTDPRRFDHPLSVKQASDTVQAYVGSSNVQIVAEDEASAVLALQLMTAHGLGRRRLSDTFIAASLLYAGVTDLATCNPDDFRAFDALKLHDPCSRRS